MSVLYVNAVKRRSIPGISGSELAVLFALADYADDTGAAWPSVGTLAQDAGISLRQARRIISRLVERGVLHCASRRGGRRGDGGVSNRYLIDLDALQGGAVTRAPVSSYEPDHTRTPATANPDTILGHCRPNTRTQAPYKPSRTISKEESVPHPIINHSTKPPRAREARPLRRGDDDDVAGGASVGAEERVARVPDAASADTVRRAQWVARAAIRFSAGNIHCGEDALARWLLSAAPPHGLDDDGVLATLAHAARTAREPVRSPAFFAGPILRAHADALAGGDPCDPAGRAAANGSDIDR